MPPSTKCAPEIVARAVAVAKKSSMLHQHGCVIVHNGKIVAEGWNYNTEFMSHRFSIHAEIDALMKVKQRGRKFMEDCTLVVIRLSHTNIRELKLSKPCRACMTEIEKLGIRKVFYSINASG